MKGGEGGEGGAERCVLGRSPFDPALERALAQVQVQVQLVSTSYWGRYSRRRSPRPIEHEQQLLFESTRLPASGRGRYSSRRSSRPIEHEHRLLSECIRLSASSRRRYSRRRSRRPSEQEQQLPSDPSESTRLPASRRRGGPRRRRRRPAKSKSTSSSLPASCSGRYSRRRSLHLIEREQPLLPITTHYYPLLPITSHCQPANLQMLSCCSAPPTLSLDQQNAWARVPADILWTTHCIRLFWSYSCLRRLGEVDDLVDAVNERLELCLEHTQLREVEGGVATDPWGPCATGGSHGPPQSPPTPACCGSRAAPPQAPTGP